MIPSSNFTGDKVVSRFFDIILSLLGLIIFSPVLLVAGAFVWMQDFHSPLYVATRVGKEGRPFRMMKLRSMVVHADKSGVDSTGSDDKRITAVGRFVRRYKLDELTQLLNVLIGDMSLVGPRPNVERETNLYTSEERLLLSVRPGITDIASIVFSDEGDILKGYTDPDLAYNQLIRPGKGRLGIFYVKKKTLWLDLVICLLTAVSIVSRTLALSWLNALLRRLDAPDELLTIAARSSELQPMPPVGASEIVTSRGAPPLSA